MNDRDNVTAKPFLDAERFLASTSPQLDKYWLYLLFFQQPLQDVETVCNAYHETRRREPFTLREDFCGTAAISCAWVNSHERKTAVAIDIEEEPLNWGRAHFVPFLSQSECSRITLRQGDATQASERSFDIIWIPNSSVFLIHHRAELISYIRQCYQALEPDGMLAIDLFAGPGSIARGFDFLVRFDHHARWNQNSYDLLSGVSNCSIDFVSSDGRLQLTGAFEYIMRIWSPSELADVAAEIGFQDTRLVPRALREDASTRVVDDDCPAWDVFIMAFK